MDDFSDDALDDLNDLALQELENNALQFTQAQPPLPTQDAQLQQSSNYMLDADDDDLDDTVVIDELAPLPARRPVDQPRPGVPGSAIRPPNASLASRSRYPPSSPPRPPLQHAYPPRPPVQQPRPGPSQARFPRPPPPIPGTSRYTPQLQPSQAVPPNMQNEAVETLGAQLRSLKNELLAAKGEAALMRSKFDDARKTHEADIVRLKKQNAEQLAKQERLAEAAMVAEKTAATELEFTRQDLREELDKTRKNRKEPPTVTTPRKDAANAGRKPTRDFADGFDDIEILPSPSRAQARRAKDSGPVAVPVYERTPTKGKRKRPPIDSPVTALETHSEDAAASEAALTIPAEAGQSAWSANALPFDFLQLVLDHRGFHDRPLTFDVLARYFFPSDPMQSFASIIFQRLPQLGSPQDPMRLLVDFCELVLELWAQCLREKYYEPVYDLVSLLSFVLLLNTSDVAPRIVSNLVHTTQTTIYLVAEPTFNSPDGNLSAHPDPTVLQLYPHIDTLGTLSIMYLTALSCLSWLPPTDDADPAIPSPEPPIKLYWRLMQLEFVLMMLSPKQPPDEFFGILAMLRTSVLPESIGPTGDPTKDAKFVARVLIERVSYQLTDQPKWAPRGSYKSYEVRLSALETLTSFARSPFGKAELAKSELAMPRMVTMLSGAIDALYDMDVPQEFTILEEEMTESHTVVGQESNPDPNSTQDQPPVAAAASDRLRAPAPPSDGEKDIVPMLHKLIAMTTRLLHTLITDPATSNSANIAQKLSVFQGGYQRYLLSLARLSFAEEDLVFEAGIEAETVELAHEMLELAVTPDEGEGICEVFGL